MDATWIVTTKDAAWQARDGLHVSGVTGVPDVMVKAGAQQTIEGFGACFNELGWTSLALLDDADRDAVLRELFAPGVGAGLSLCRMPVGANDFARDWYSYDETPGDLGLDHFDIGNDLDTLVPFIRAARDRQPGLRLWASPWSPPTWMKTNGHYAAAMPGPASHDVDNGLRPEQAGAEGTDMFRIDDAHLRAYAAYFGRFIDAYRQLGIPIEMVMPQNEFNSAQVFPSCTWTPDGLARFLAHLGPEMRGRGVEIFLGTLERGDDRLLGDVLADPALAAHVTGLGVQWEGKKAVAVLHRLYPRLRIYQTEQECGDGRNDWRYARYTWTLMRHFLRNGANAYMYWNISLPDGGRSRWGWTQNSLVVVDPHTRAHRFTHDYQVLKHIAAHVRPGARVLDTWSLAGYDNQLVFANPDGSTVIVAQNDLGEDLPVRYLLGDRTISAVLPADSFNTLVVPPDATP
ncbi:glycoside hydrolase family 30 protein [Dactylosporangium sp. CS-033363]|uniref:glycoside hydrolase family 30 protein n=1 Tax=Dactylosporangium sp. CS-033363 TaxID=3239935 RepID=UPI003D8D43C9